MVCAKAGRRRGRPKCPLTAARNEWMFQLWLEGENCCAIRIKLERRVKATAASGVPEAMRWKALKTERAVNTTLARYAEAHDLDFGREFQPRQDGK